MKRLASALSNRSTEAPCDPLRELAVVVHKRPTVLPHEGIEFFIGQSYLLELVADELAYRFAPFSADGIERFKLDLVIRLAT